METVETNENQVVLNQLEKEINEAYDAISATVFAFAKRGGVDVFNLQVVFKQVMEGVEALGALQELTGPQKGQLAQDFCSRIMDDLHTKGLITDDFYAKAKDAVKYIGPAVFSAIVLASKGQILVNAAVEEIKEHCGCFKPKTTTKSKHVSKRK